MQRNRTNPLLTLAAGTLVLLAACSTTADTNSGNTTFGDTTFGDAGPSQSIESAQPVAAPTTEIDGGDDDSFPLPVLEQPSTTTGAGDTADELPETPAPPTTFAPVELTAVEGPAPIQPPPPTPAPADLTANPVVIDQLVSNAPGCASNCITKAVLSPGAIATPASIEVATNVATRSTLWMSTQSIQTGTDGTPSFPGSPAPVASSAGFRRNWTAQISNLSPNHRYRAILRVVDRFGNERFLTGEIRTPQGQPSDDLAAEGGCAFQCITMGVVQPTTDFDRVNLVVATDVTARLAVYVSTSEPGYMADTPVLPPTALVTTTELGTTWSIPVDGLAGDTTYHVIVKAQDADGDTAHRVGQFHTMPEPPTLVKVTVEHIYLTEDGDPGANRGELTFMWGAYNDIPNGVYSPRRESTGYELVPNEDNEWTVSLAPGEMLPRFGATVWEADSAADNEPSCWTTYTLVTLDGTRFIELCDLRGNGVYTAPMTVDYLRGLSTCSIYGLVGHDDDGCVLLSTTGGTENYAQIQVLISFQIL